MPQLRIHERALDGRARVVSVAGEVDRETCADLSRVLDRVTRKTQEPVVVLDFAAVPFLDSSGLSVLLNAARRLTRRGRALKVACPPGSPRRVIELTRLEGTLGVAPSVDAALAAAG